MSVLRAFDRIVVLAPVLLVLALVVLMHVLARIFG
jgi:hypothetical protein